MKHLLAIFLVGLFFRFLYLDVIPVSLAHDEIDNIIQAQSVRHTGSDISGTWKPMRLLPTPTLMGELAPLINIPLLSVLPQSIFSSRATSALLSSIYPILLLFFLTSIGVSRKVGLATAWLLVISPWHIIFSRTALEQPASLFFYTLSWVFLTSFLKERKISGVFFARIAAFIIFYLLGFFTYHGFKFSLPIITSVIAFYVTWFSTLKHKWLKFTAIMLFIAALFVHVVLNQSSYSTRSVEIIFKDMSKFSENIDFERRVSLAPDFLKPVFSNKYISLSQAIGDKYLYAISPDMLFQHGENNGMFALWTIGYFYLFCIPLIIIGFMSMLRTRRKEQMLILVIFILSPIASIIHTNNSFAFRSAIYFIFLNIIIAYGVLEVCGYISHNFKQYKGIITIGVAAIVAVSLIHFSYLYFYISPVNNSGSYFLGERLVSQYINLSPNTKILVVDPQPRYLYSSLLLSSPEITAQDIASYDHQYSSSENDYYSNNNVTVMRNCPESVVGFDTIIIGSIALKDSLQCGALIEKRSHPEVNTSAIVSVKDSGVERFIIGDNLCKDIELRTYVHPTSLRDFKLNKLSLQEFCLKWVVKQ